jgi:hypothetical protein
MQAARADERFVQVLGVSMHQAAATCTWMGDSITCSCGSSAQLLILAGAPQQASRTLQQLLQQGGLWT